MSRSSVSLAPPNIAIAGVCGSALPLQLGAAMRHAHICAALAIALAGPARADNAEAEVLFAEADRLMKAGDLARACEAFEGSNRLEPRAGTLLRLGECREQNRELASAWSAYKDALTRVKDPRKKAIATAKISELEPKLSYLTVSVSDESRVDGLALTRNGQPFDAALWNRAVPVNGGSYVIAGRAPGHEAWTTTVQVPEASGKVSVEVPKFKELEKLIAPAAGPRPEPERGGIWSTRRAAATAVAAGGLAILGAGIALGLQANHRRSEARDLCPDPMLCADAARANQLVDQAHGRALAADIAFGVSGAALIGAAVLWWTGAPHVVPADRGIAVVGRF